MKNVKRRKMLLVMPLLVIPFLTLGFWALGGGRKKTESTVTSKGLNLDFPGANLKEDKLMDKLKFYDEADKDSMKLEEWMRNDPYFKRDTVPFELQELTETTAARYNHRLNPSPYETTSANPEEKVLQKLKLLEKVMNKANVYEEPQKDLAGTADLTTQMERLEDMMKMNNSNASDDPEMKQLDGALEKILDIQHPQRVKERQQHRSLQNKQAVYAVRRESGNDTIVNGFFGLSDEKEISEHNAIEAVVHENQMLVNGSVMKFRLVNEIYVHGKLVPEGSFVYGVAQLDGERLIIEINSIRSTKNLFNVKLEVFDMDGLAGIYIPGAISRDVAKQSADNSLSLMEMGSLDPSLKAQATSAGIGAAKNLLSRKVKLVKVLVKAGYKVLLKDKNAEQ